MSVKDLIDYINDFDKSLESEDLDNIVNNGSYSDDDFLDGKNSLFEKLLKLSSILKDDENTFIEEKDGVYTFKFVENDGISMKVPNWKHPDDIFQIGVVDDDEIVNTYLNFEYTYRLVWHTPFKDISVEDDETREYYHGMWIKHKELLYPNGVIPLTTTSTNTKTESENKDQTEGFTDSSVWGDTSGNDNKKKNKNKDKELPELSSILENKGNGDPVDMILSNFGKTNNPYIELAKKKRMTMLAYVDGNEKPTLNDLLNKRNKLAIEINENKEEEKLEKEKDISEREKDPYKILNLQHDRKDLKRELDDYNELATYIQDDLTNRFFQILVHIACAIGIMLFPFIKIPDMHEFLLSKCQGKKSDSHLTVPQVFFASNQMEPLRWFKIFGPVFGVALGSIYMLNSGKFVYYDINNKTKEAIEFQLGGIIFLYVLYQLYLLFPLHHPKNTSFCISQRIWGTGENLTSILLIIFTLAVSGPLFKLILKSFYFIPITAVIISVILTKVNGDSELFDKHIFDNSTAKYLKIFSYFLAIISIFLISFELIDCLLDHLDSPIIIKGIIKGGKSTLGVFGLILPILLLTFNVWSSNKIIAGSELAERKKVTKKELASAGSTFTNTLKRWHDFISLIIKPIKKVLAAIGLVTMKDDTDEAAAVAAAKQADDALELQRDALEKEANKLSEESQLKINMITQLMKLCKENKVNCDIDKTISSVLDQGGGVDFAGVERAIKDLRAKSAK